MPKKQLNNPKRVTILIWNPNSENDGHIALWTDRL
jgi:hypothetical protein